MEPIIGQIMLFGGNFAPRGWAFCDGQLLEIASHDALFAILGTTYGGDGSTTFGLPDLRGRVPMHAGEGPGLTARKIGQRMGAEGVALTPTQMPAHGHDFLVANTPANKDDPTGEALGQSDIYVGVSPSEPATEPSVALNAKTVGETGGSAPHENMQPTLCINYIIALQGMFPSRN